MDLLVGLIPVVFLLFPTIWQLSAWLCQLKILGRVVLVAACCLFLWNWEFAFPVISLLLRLLGIDPKPQIEFHP